MSEYMDRLSTVWLTLTTDTELSRYVTEQDRKVFLRRCEAEGIMFLTVTLPRLAKALEDSFRTSIFKPVEGFAKVKHSTYPQFLAKAFSVLFYDEEGIAYLRPEIRTSNSWNLSRHLDGGFEHTVVGAVRAIRQLSLMYYKTELPYSKEQVKKCNDAFMAAERDLAQFELDRPTYVDGTEDFEVFRSASASTNVGRRSGLLTRASVLVKYLLQDSDPTDIHPKHGSGASACKQTPWDRYEPKMYVPKLDRIYPYSSWFYSGANALVDNLDQLQALPTVDRPMARIAYVPKDSRGPRIISTEPAELMFIQQGLMTKLYAAIEAYPLIRAQLSCLDQTRNQNLAREASILGSFATLDLKEASDRVSLWLVRRLFPSRWVECLESCRSEGTVFPDGTIVMFRKFAPMGSAVCFPVEAICFWALTLAAIESNERELVKVLFTRSSKAVCPDNYRITVFGDDIIIPAVYWEPVNCALDTVGLVVNTTKSYVEGPFRESCGADYFFGNDVSYTRCGNIPTSPDKRNDALTIRTLTAEWFNNLIGRWSTTLTEPLYRIYHSWYGDIPLTSRWEKSGSSASPSNGGLCLISDYDDNRLCPTRWNELLSRREVWTVVGLPVMRLVPRVSWSFVLLSLLSGGGTRVIKPGSQNDNPDRFALAKRTKYKYGWVPL